MLWSKMQMFFFQALEIHSKDNCVPTTVQLYRAYASD